MIDKTPELGTVREIRGDGVRRLVAVLTWWDESRRRMQVLGRDLRHALATVRRRRSASARTPSTTHS